MEIDPIAFIQDPDGYMKKMIDQRYVEESMTMLREAIQKDHNELNKSLAKLSSGADLNTAIKALSSAMLCASKVRVHRTQFNLTSSISDASKAEITSRCLAVENNLSDVAKDVLKGLFGHMEINMPPENVDAAKIVIKDAISSLESGNGENLLDGGFGLTAYADSLILESIANRNGSNPAPSQSKKM